jgi:protein-S-isoprenylcysteine O-methyltransferase Ste14
MQQGAPMGYRGGRMRDFLLRRGFILPVMVTGAIPMVIVVTTRAWERASVASVLVGAAAWIAGFALLVRTSRLFARHGGALAPWNPPTSIVLVGPYRYVRNPMISGIFLMLIGEATAFLSHWLGGWFCFFVLAQFAYVYFDEEPALRKRFGAAYEQYCREVPRWIPRLKSYSQRPSNDARERS